MQKLADITLEYGPLKVPAQLFGTRKPDGFETYVFGVVNSIGASYLEILLSICNESHAFGLENIYVEGDPNIPTVEEE